MLASIDFVQSHMWIVKPFWINIWNYLNLYAANNVLHTKCNANLVLKFLFYKFKHYRNEFKDPFLMENYVGLRPPVGK